MRSGSFVWRREAYWDGLLTRGAGDQVAEAGVAAAEVAGELAGEGALEGIGDGRRLVQEEAHHLLRDHRDVARLRGRAGRRARRALDEGHDAEERAGLDGVDAADAVAARPRHFHLAVDE